MAQLFHFHPPAQSKPRVVVISEPETQSKTRTARRSRFLWYGITLGVLLVLALVEFARAGNPAFVAGMSYFDPGVAGQPITWAGGTVSYYTDQGNLSPILHGPDADAFVADAFTRWTGIPTAALSTIRAGQLAEDVNGSNVILNADWTITMPADILPSATGTPVGIAYDADGAVTDALLGTGASGDCFNSSAFGGPDAFGPDGHITHALIILNGLCAQSPAQLPDLKYHLVRVMGQVLGLGWSQLNVNVNTWSPLPTVDDLAGFPVMHPFDSWGCVPIAVCYPNPDQPRVDDRAGLSRLYPVTGANIGLFSGKQLLAATTARIHGSVRFTDAYGTPEQAMQGVNIVARWVDPGSGQPSSIYAASSVSGFLFCGNAGNPITGSNDALGQPLNRYGSADLAVEGFFDLAGLPIPNGTSAQYQLTVEALDPIWSQPVGPYSPGPVQPSGHAAPIVVTVRAGDDVSQDVLMLGSSVQPDAVAPHSFAAPATLPHTGEWLGTLSPYGGTDYFSVDAQAARTMAIEVTAVDETGQPTAQKAQPLIGMWALSDSSGTAPGAFTPMAFLGATTGLTSLNAQLAAAGTFRIGIADTRGDGRPDYRYRGRVLYGDTVEPDRIGVRGSVPLEIDGLGFRRGMMVSVGNTNASLLAISQTDLLVVAPSLGDGTQSITLTDPATGDSVSLQNALTIGAGPNDLIRLTQGGNTPTPVGGEGADPVRVTVATADGSTPVGGATVQWSATNGATLTVCGGATSCSVTTDEQGKTESRVDVGATGTATVTATLAPASYSPAKFVQTVVSGTSSASDISMFAPKSWVLKGTTVDVVVTARLLANGVAVRGQTVNFQLALGSGTLTPASAVTDVNGFAKSTLHIASMSGDVQGTACLAPANNPCQSFYAMMVTPVALRLENVSGSLQAIPVGESFQPIWVRVTDSASPPNPVIGAPVVFQSTAFLPDGEEATESDGESSSTHHAMKVLLGSSQGTAISDANGLVNTLPTAGVSRPVELDIVATAGANAQLQFQFNVLPPLIPAETGASTGTARTPVGTGTRRDAVTPTPGVNPRIVLPGPGRSRGVPAPHGTTSSSTDRPSR